MISGFALESTGNDTWVVFGDNGKKVNIVHTNKLTHVHNQKWCGCLYTRCELESKVYNPNMTVYGLEATMVDCC